VAFLSNSSRISRITVPMVTAFLLCATHFAAARPDEPLPDTVGLIDGEAIAVSGPMRVEMIHGQAKTVLRSGSDVRVKSGTARIDLVEGGQIAICGPAHFSLLKSGSSLTVALDSGILHAYIEREPALTVYTAQIQARTISIGDGPQDVLVGFETPGSMCIRATRGAVRVEQQLTGQSVVIPQAGDVLLLNGQLDGLRASTGHCSCELQVAKTAPPPQPEAVQLAAPEETRERSADAQPATPEEPREKSADAKPVAPAAPAQKPAPKEEPIYKVFMPPLVYDAQAKEQPEIDPRMILIVRRVRVRPALVFQGRVEGEAVAAATPPPAPPPAAAPAPKAPAPANDSFISRVWNFFRKLWSRRS
jgi:hypothetical protein